MTDDVTDGEVHGYCEHAVTGPWRSAVLCAWTATAGAEDGPRLPIVPDGCVDVLWSSSAPVVVVGPMTRPALPESRPGTAHVALRFRPGHAVTVLGRPASELTDLTVGLDAFVGPVAAELEERLEACDGPAARVRTLAGLAGVVPRDDLDHLAVAASRWLAVHPNGRIADLARHLGVGERQLHRRVTAAVGYGPKRFQRIARFQQLLGAAQRRGTSDLAQLASALGYADQPHLTRETRALAGGTPMQVLGTRWSNLA